MQRRLLAAVRALLSDVRIASLNPAGRCTSVVLLAKSDAVTSVTKATVADLARWMGVSRSSLDHDVLPRARAAKAITTKWLPPDDAGRPTGLAITLAAVKEARAAGRAAPLALERVELSVLLALCEAVASPGYGLANPPGLLARRVGRDAALDRLALLLLALLARPSGRVRLVSGPLPAGVDRGVATLARELRSSAALAETVLGRLTATGLVVWAPAEPGRRVRLTVPLVAAAHRRLSLGDPCASVAVTARQVEAEDDNADAPGGGCSCCTGECGVEVELSGDGWVQESLEDVAAASIARSSSADGELRWLESPPTPGPMGSDGPADHPLGAETHTNHAYVHEVLDTHSVRCGFSGSAVETSAASRSDARAHEELPARAHLTDRDAAVNDPLRGDKRHTTPRSNRQGRDQASHGPTVALQPVDAPGLEPVLAAAGEVWSQITHQGGREVVLEAVRTEVTRVMSVLGLCDATAVLADRVQARLKAQAGRPVRSAVGWLVACALPQRPGCASERCDDGLDLATGQPCAGCEDLRLGRRADRDWAMEQVRSRMPQADAEELRAAAEALLGERWRAAAEDKVRRSARAAQAAVARLAATKAAQVASELEQERQIARPCTRCGAAQASGMCARCSDLEATAAAIEEAGRIAGAGWREGASAGELGGRAEARVRALVEATRARVQADGDAGMAAGLGRLVAEAEVGRLREEVLRQLEVSPQALAEGHHACAVQTQRLRFRADRDAARAAVEEAGAAARARAAAEMLRLRLSAPGRGPVAVDVSDRVARAARLRKWAERPLEIEELAVGA